MRKKTMQDVHTLSDKKLNFLVEAGRMLSSSLDYDTTLTSVAQFAVSTIANLCDIMIFDEGVLRHVAVIDSDPEMNKIVNEFYKYPPAPGGKMGAYYVAETRKTLLVSPTNDEWLRSITVDEEDYENMKKLNYISSIVVPLIVRDKVIGVLSLKSRERLFDDSDVELTEELASRAAIAVDNARLYKEAQEAIRARDEFLSISSHELKTPLTSIILQLQIALRTIEHTEKPSKEQVVKMLYGAEKQSKKLQKLINDLLNISLITTGRLHLEKEKTDFSQLVYGVLERFSHLFQKEKVHVDLDIEDGVEGYFDHVRMEQVISNLVTNAVKYGNKTPVHITVKKFDSTVRFTIQDKGIGIDPATQKEIFERFARGVATRDYRGLGVGLYISRQIVEAHGGTISLDSEVGKGSTFTLHLPLETTSSE